MEEILSQAQHVRINHGKMLEFAKLHAHDNFGLPRWDAPVFLETGSIEDAARLLILGNSINFHYYVIKDGKFDNYAFTYNGVRWEEAFGMWAALKNAFETGVPITNADFLSRMTPEEFAWVFRTDKSHLPMAEERLGIFRNLGNVLKKKYDSDFRSILEATRDGDGRCRIFNEGKGLVEILVRDFPHFRDEAKYNGMRAVFNKRAQLAAFMIYEKILDMSGTEIFPEEDVKALTVAPDYMLPMSERILGFLEYSEELANKVDNYIEIESGSHEEVEIRTATKKIAHDLAYFINRFRPDGPEICDIHMDYLLWQMGVSMPSKGIHPHNTLTTAY
jgi:hypothetical protein